MQKLRERLKDQKGFTLVEMLIVVAIIAILIAVSVPMVNKSLEKARHAVDTANLRDAISLANIEILTSVNADGSLKTIAKDTEYTYYVNDKTHQGRLETGSFTETGWSACQAQCTGVLGTTECTNKGKTLKVKFGENNDFTAAFDS